MSNVGARVYVVIDESVDRDENGKEKVDDRQHNRS